MLLKPAFGGFWCEQAGLVIDPAQKVKLAVITHAHSDHARAASENIICHKITEPLIRLRLGNKPVIHAIDYGETLNLNGVQLSLHPAGHIPGSAQIRLEYRGEIWVASGDYKLAYDGLSTPFEPISCHHFITESTFALPLFQFPQAGRVLNDAASDFQEVSRNESAQMMIGAYSIGKAQRLALEFSSRGFDIVCTPIISEVMQAMEPFGLIRFSWRIWKGEKLRAREILFYGAGEGKPDAHPGTSICDAQFSGWNHLPGSKRATTNFAYTLSDHADWNELLSAIKQTGAETIWCTHGFSAQLARYVSEELKLDGRVWG
jgi:putative mRNA 3-end processing factor